jgi:hypothetical protein
LGRRYVTSIAIDIFFLKTAPLGSNEMLLKKDTIVRKGPLRHRTGQEIAEELNSLTISAGRDEFEGYGKEHN